MNKDIYKMLNEIDIDLEGYERNDFNEMEKKRINKKLKKSIKGKSSIYKKYVAVASIGVLTIGLLSTNLGNNILAYANDLVYGIANSLRVDKDVIDEYGTVLNKTVRNNGLAISLNEVVLDNDELIVSTNIKSDEKISNHFMLFSDLYINGKKVCCGSGGSQKIVDEHTVVDIRDFKMVKHPKGDLNIKIIYEGPFVNEKLKEGKWVFEFKINGDKLAKDTREIPINYTFTLENGQKVTLDKYSTNSLGQKIYYVKHGKCTNHNNYDIVLRGYDNLGNDVEFYMSSEENKKGLMKLNNFDSNLGVNAKKLYLIPYAAKFPEKSGKMSNDFKKAGEEFVIELLTN